MVRLLNKYTYFFIQFQMNNFIMNRQKSTNRFKDIDEFWKIPELQIYAPEKGRINETT